MKFNHSQVNHKGDANMWWIIIGAVIALIVLIVLLIMFTTRGNKLELGLSACNGICTKAGETTCPLKTQSSNAFDCNTGGVCCIGFAQECPTNNDEVCQKSFGGKAQCHGYGDKKSYCVEP